MSRVYHLIKPNSGIRARVCQAYFLSTFDISEKMIRSVVKKTDSSGTVKKDERGFATPPTTLPEERMKTVVNHILQFKTVESHYICKDSSCQYVPKHLNVAEMHRMYIQWCAFNDYSVKNYDTYYMIFKQHFNLRFKKPKKDQCDTCTAYKNTPNDLITDEMRSHQTKPLHDKELVRQYKENKKLNATSNDDILIAVFDFQKTLLCPHGQTSSFYYCRRLRNYNFTITNLS